jgi:hypothetical protein
LEFLEIISDFEKQIKKDLKYELLEMHYVPYSFGSGFVAYRINGRIVKIIFDGKDNLIESKISSRHERYPAKSVNTFFSGAGSDFSNNGIIAMKNELMSKTR